MANVLGGKAFKAIAHITGDPPGVEQRADVLLIDGQVYLIPLWSDRRGQGTTTPARMLHVPPGTYEAAQVPDILLRLLRPIPKSLWDGEVDEADGYRAVEMDGIQIALPPGQMN